jgi:hypothetical protein
MAAHAIDAHAIDAHAIDARAFDWQHGRSAAAPAPPPWPAAALAIGSLSAGLWLGIVWLAATLL